MGIGALHDVLTSQEFRGILDHSESARCWSLCGEHEPQYGLTRLEFKEQFLFVPLQSVPVGQSVRVHILSSDVSLVVGRTEFSDQRVEHS